VGNLAPYFTEVLPPYSLIDPYLQTTHTGVVIAKDDDLDELEGIILNSDSAMSSCLNCFRSTIEKGKGYWKMEYTFYHLEMLIGEVVHLSLTITDKKVNLFGEFTVEINIPPVDEEI